MSKVFAIRPRPNAQECFEGYLLRLANVNGYPCPKSLLRAVGESLHQQHLKVGSEHFNTFVKKLAPMLKMSHVDLATPFRESSINYRAVKTRLKEIRSEHLNVCLECLTSNAPFINSDWKQLHVTHCEIHKRPLIDSCPVCQTPLPRSAFSLEGCSSCGTLWQDIELPAQESIPDYQTSYNGVCKLEKRVKLERLYFAATCIHQATNFSITSYRKLRLDLKSSRHVFSLAHQAAISTVFNAGLLGKIQNAVTAPLNFYSRQHLEKFCPHPLVKISDEPASQPNNIINLLPFNVSTGATVDEKQLRALTGLDKQSVFTFIDLELITSNGSNSHRYNLSDADRVMTRLHAHAAKFTFPNDKRELISITHAAKELPKFLTKLPLVLEYFIANDLPIWRASHTALLDEMYVERDTLVEEANSSNLPILLTPATADELSKFFGLDKAKLFKMVEIYEWEKVRHTRAISYEFTDIMAFTSKYGILEQWCKTRFYPLGDAYRYLKSVGIETVSLKDEQSYNLFIYEKSPALMQALSDFEDAWLNDSNKSLLKERMRKFKPVFYSEKIKAFLNK